MARTGKIGIDYFSHDVNMRSDPKVRLLIAKCGSDGYSVYNMLLESAYAENGYYLQLSDDYNILFSNDCKIDFNAYILILNECINTGLFCDELHKKYSILTSRRIQKNYIDATQRRKEVSFLKEYLLVNPAEMYPERVNVSILNLNVRINPQNEDIGTQRERESKEKEKRYTDDALRVAEYMLSQIETHMPNHKKWNVESWAKDIDLAIRIDKRTPRELCDLAKWIHVEDPSGFDRPNVLSGKKLRDRFDQINGKRKNKPVASKNEWSMENRKML